MTGTNKLRHLAVVAIFAFAGACASVVPHFANKHILNFIDSKSAGAVNDDVMTLFVLLIFPGLIFALMIYVAGRLCWGFELIPQRFRISSKRTMGALLVFALIFPIGVFVMGMTAISMLPHSGDSGDLNAPPDTPLQHFLREMIIPTALMVGAMTAVLMSAGALLIWTTEWPRNIWAGALVIMIGVPLLTIAVAWVTTFISPAAMRIIPGDILSLLFAEAADTLLLVLIGEPVLAGTIGYWLYQAATAAASPSSN